MPDQFQQLFGFSVRDKKHDLNSEIAAKFKKMFFLQVSMPTETSDGAEYGATVNTKFFGLFQQPFVEQFVVVLLVFMDIKGQASGVHGSALCGDYIHPLALNRLKLAMPSVVMMRDPPR